MERCLKNFNADTSSNSKCKSIKSKPSATSSQRNKEYDQNKRSRGFVSAWKTEFPWVIELEKDGEKQNIVC